MTFLLAIDNHFQNNTKKREEYLGGAFAVQTTAIKLKTVTNEGKTMLPCHLVLKLLDTWIFEFNDLATGNTNQVIVMLIVVACFITRLTITKMALLGNTAFSKQLQGAVNSCIADAGISPAQTEIEFFCGEV